MARYSAFLFAFAISLYSFSDMITIFSFLGLDFTAYYFIAPFLEKPLSSTLFRAA